MPIPDQQTFAQSGAGGNQRAVPNLAGVAFGQRVNLVRREFGHAVPIRLQVID